MEIDILRQIVGRSLRQRRKDRGLTQERLASLTSVTRTSITNIERGHQLVSLPALYEIAEALDAEIGDLVPTRAEIERYMEAMSRVPLIAEEKADIAHWVDSVTAQSDSTGGGD